MRLFMVENDATSFPAKYIKRCVCLSVYADIR